MVTHGRDQIYLFVARHHPTVRDSRLIVFETCVTQPSRPQRIHADSVRVVAQSTRRRTHAKMVKFGRIIP